MALFTGEIGSLRKAFHETFGEKRDLLKQKQIVKQVIGCMTMGIDASPLFTEMIMVRDRFETLYSSFFIHLNAELLRLASRWRELANFHSADICTRSAAPQRRVRRKI